ncbi:MAG: outer membrane lipoprotein-sorting protein, partial [Schleiferiaceae bacterium]
MFFRIVFFFTLILSNLSLNGQDPVSILQKAEKASQQIPSYSEIEIISERPRYSRKIKLRNWSLNNNYSIVEISSPKRDSGMVYMKAGKKLFTYSPKTDRIIKLPSSMLAQGWMGTDAQFDNILGAASLSKDFNHELKLPVDVNNESCHFIRCVPLPETTVAHDH